MKLKNLTIENFRGLERFTLSDLGRVNLLVGTNNSGKTTVLEAANILMSGQKFWAIWTTLSSRGEMFRKNDRLNTMPSDREVVDVRRLFHNHIINVGSNFKISANTDIGDFKTQVFIEPSSDSDEAEELDKLPNDFSNYSLSNSSEDSRPSLSLTLEWKHGALKEPDSPIRGLLLDKDGFLSSRFYRRQAAASSWITSGNSIRFVTASALTSGVVANLFERIVLTEEEDLVVEALKIIEPTIERIASAGSESGWAGSPARVGILVRLAGVKDRVPIGSMGDGIWRMLGLALAVVASGKGILLIDEVDTGLHHSVMDDMWRFLNECSKKFNVQIIATTHSRDCYQSLATICREDVIEQSEVTIQRIERDRSEAVAYSEAEIIVAAERDIEVR